MLRSKMLLFGKKDSMQERNGGTGFYFKLLRRCKKEGLRRRAALSQLFSRYLKWQVISNGEEKLSFIYTS